MTPHQKLPETTQAHVDRVVGTTVGDHRVVRHVAEGRFGTLYRCEHVTGGKAATLEVLRTQLVGNDREARAANAIKCPGIATVTAFGALPDGRHWRLMELLDGESLDQALSRRKKLPAGEVVALLARVAAVLEAAHAWAVVHGGLLASNVFVVAGEVKLIDFGLARQPVSVLTDLGALGRLGFTLLTGEERTEGAPPPLKDPALEPVDRVLRELVEGRVPNATAARKALTDLSLQLGEGRPSSRRGWLAGAALLVAGAVGGAVWWTHQGAEDNALTDEEASLLDEASDEPLDVPDALEPVPAVESPDKAEGAPARPLRPKARRPGPPPDAATLSSLISELEAQLLARRPPRDELDQALHVLAVQRLRLAGAPTVKDRRDVARQLAGWKRSYLGRR